MMDSEDRQSYPFYSLRPLPATDIPDSQIQPVDGAIPQTGPVTVCESDKPQSAPYGSTDRPSPLKPSGYQFRVTFLVALLTAVCVGFTIFYAYNATVDPPVSRTLLLSNPSRTILVINILSHVTMFLLSVLSLAVYEGIRWALACGGGLSIPTFISLSPATSPMGVLYLFFHRANSHLNFLRGHHLWGSQRYLLIATV